VLNTFASQIGASQILADSHLEPRHYFLVTMHREENVDDPRRLRDLLEGLERLAVIYQEPIVVSLHPRTRDKIRQYDLKVRSELIRLLDPLGFFDFVALERNVRCVLTDSGTVQEECCIFGVPNVTMRDVTERPETLECGSNILTGTDPEMIVQAVDIALNSSHDWKAPPEYMILDLSTGVTKIVLSHYCQPHRR